MWLLKLLLVVSSPQAPQASVAFGSPTPENNKQPLTIRNYSIPGRRGGGCISSLTNSFFAICGGQLIVHTNRVRIRQKAPHEYCFAVRGSSTTLCIESTTFSCISTASPPAKIFHTILFTSIGFILSNFQRSTLGLRQLPSSKDSYSTTNLGSTWP